MNTETQALIEPPPADQLGALFESIATAAFTSIRLLADHPGDGNVEHAVQVMLQTVGAAADKGLITLGKTQVTGSIENWLNIA